ncbi:MAG TPA: MMPL family transporter [Alphaproteobacteria bacterium]|nr:MMPL family transporter [Alphaproteobacteria bacterium]
MQQFENFVFRYRAHIISILGVFTVLMGFSASNLTMDAGYRKMLPVGHPYIDTFLQYSEAFGGGNRVIVVLEAKHGEIWTGDFLSVLKNATDDIFFIPGVARHTVTSLWTPNTRYLGVTEEGLEAGDVIPASYRPTPEGINQVIENTLRANLPGRLVATNFKSAMIRAELLDFDPETKQRLNYFQVADMLESFRAKYTSDDIDVKIVGFAKFTGDVADGARNVVVFFVVAFALTCLMLWLYCRSWLLTMVTVSASLCSLIWQFGLLHIFGFGLDPLSILVPFLVFAIGVSHGVQQVNRFGAEIASGLEKEQAARLTFSFLLRPGSVALLTVLTGFATLYIIPIGMIQELAITASIGVGLKIISNMIMLPLLFSYISPGAGYAEKVNSAVAARARFWPYLAKIAIPRNAMIFIGLCFLLGIVGIYQGADRQIGDVHEGAGELRPESRYNMDSKFIASNFALGLNVLTVIAETPKSACVDYGVMDFLDRFAWEMRNVPGVETTHGLTAIAKAGNALWQEGHLKMSAIPRSSTAISQATNQTDTSSGLLDGQCTILPTQIYLTDTKAKTVNTVIAAVEKFIKDPANQSDDVKLRIGAGNVTIVSATNQEVEDSEIPMLLYVYGVVMALVIIVYREWRGSVCLVVPLILSTIIGNWFITGAGIGLKISTLPVLAIAVGIGIDYGIYEYNRMQLYLRMGRSPYEAFLGALNDVGSATIFTGGTLAIGVSTWIFSELKFQADMGLLLTFMFIVNMVGAVTLLPAMVAFLEFIMPLERRPLTEEEAREALRAH